MSDYTITSSSVIPSASAQIVFNFTAGVELTAGMGAYLDDSSVWQKIDADNATGTEITRIVGITVNHAYTGQYVGVCIKDPAFVFGGTGTKGDTVVASTTAGGLAPRADLGSGDYVVNFGPLVDSTTLNLSPAATGTAI